MVSIIEKYTILLFNLLPYGRAWNRLRTSNLYLFISSIVVEFARIDESITQLIEEADPRTFTSSLEDWERLLGLPDECTINADQSFDERRLTVYQKLVSGGGSNIAFFQEIAAQFGYPEVRVKEYLPFRAGKSTAGDPITNTGWEYTFGVYSPDALSKSFSAGKSVAGDPLRQFGNPVMECIIKKLKPAHTTVQFTFGE